MLRRYMLPVLSLVLGGFCLSLTPGYQNTNRSNSSYSYPQDARPGVSDDSYPRQQYRDPATGREEIAYVDERDEDIHHRANRKGDWNYKQNWRYDREAFYRGETQGEAYDRENPDGVGGPGMDPDYEYLQMRRYYLQERNRQAAAAQKNNASRPNAQAQYNAYRNNGYNQPVGQQSGQYSRPGYSNGNANQNYQPNYYPNGYPSDGYYQ